VRVGGIRSGGDVVRGLGNGNQGFGLLLRTGTNLNSLVRSVHGNGLLVEAAAHGKHVAQPIPLDTRPLNDSSVYRTREYH
jgi:hypothetical protein